MKGLIVALVLVIGPEAFAADWSVVKTKHFIVKHQGTKTFAQTVAREAEVLYVSVSRKSLGFKRYDNFWLWEDRATIFLYPSHAAYLAGTGAPKWTAGKAVYSKREIHSFVGSGTFVSDILPHEMTHLIFREATDASAAVPLWVHEGLAQWHEPSKRRRYEEGLRIAASRGQLIPLSVLGATDVRKVDSHGQAKAFYGHSAGLVAFMINEWGAQKMAEFCRALRDGKGLDGALKFTYRSKCPSIKELEAVWKSHLLEKSEWILRVYPY